MSGIERALDRGAARGVGLLALLLAGCAPYLRTDMPTQRPPGARDALASLLGVCDEPRPGDPAAARPESTPGEERREQRRCDAASDGTTATPAGPTQKKP